MEIFRDIFGEIFGMKEHEAPQPLSVEGAKGAPVTAEADEAEVAAQALLEMMAGSAKKKGRGNKTASSSDSDGDDRRDNASWKSADYYRALAQRIREAHKASEVRTMRFLAFCEQELKKPYLPRSGKGSLGQMEAELYKRIDVADYFGGEMKRRWQFCLAEVTVRLMDAMPQEEKGNKKD